MTDLDPCLLGCDLALAEAERLVALLSAEPDSFTPEIEAVRDRIARLRREVDRLRGLKTVAPRRNQAPQWIGLDQRAVWPEPSDDAGMVR